MWRVLLLFVFLLLCLPLRPLFSLLLLYLRHVDARVKVTHHWSRSLPVGRLQVRRQQLELGRAWRVVRNDGLDAAIGVGDLVPQLVLVGLRPDRRAALMPSVAV